MDYSIFYNIMKDGTVKQVNPFTGTEVWTVPGRGNKPSANGSTRTIPEILNRDAQNHCAFCSTRYFETGPEKSRLVQSDSRYLQLDKLPASSYFNTVAEFRRTPNLFETLSIDYWRENYGYRLADENLLWKERFLSEPEGREHIRTLLTYKLQLQGKSSEEIAVLSDKDFAKLSDQFFGGSHELIIARQHYLPTATHEDDLFYSGSMTGDAHYEYIRLTIEAMKDIVAYNRYARYISIFQNYLRPAGASFDHLHKQLVALDEWGSSIERQIEKIRQDHNVFNKYGPNFAAMHNLIFAENDYALAFAGIGHRFPTVEIYSKSQHVRPDQHTPDEVRGMSDLLLACHAAIGNKTSCNEEWYYTPFDCVYPMPWHVNIKLRINVPAGFEGVTSIFINPMSPIDLRDRIVPNLYALRDKGIIGRAIRIAEECRITHNPLQYYKSSH